MSVPLSSSILLSSHFINHVATFSDKPGHQRGVLARPFAIEERCVSQKVQLQAVQVVFLNLLAHDGQPMLADFRDRIVHTSPDVPSRIANAPVRMFESKLGYGVSRRIPLRVVGVVHANGRDKRHAMLVTARGQYFYGILALLDQLSQVVGNVPCVTGGKFGGAIRGPEPLADLGGIQTQLGCAAALGQHIDAALGDKIHSLTQHIRGCISAKLIPAVIVHNHPPLAGGLASWVLG
jgi:hypothetical protein